MRSATKDNNLLHTDIKTSRKNNYAIASSSPYTTAQDKYNASNRLSNMKFRSPLREQQIEDYNRIKTQLKRQLSLAKQNFSFNQSQQQYIPIEDYLLLKEDTNYQQQRLLLQIDRLHQQVYDLEIRKNLQIQRIKQSHQQNTYLNMSQIRQGHNQQLQLLQTQLRKTKQQMSDKLSQNQTLIKRQQREIKQLTIQNNRLNQQVKNTINQKNYQLQQQLKVYEEKSNMMKRQHQQLKQQMRQLHTKQVNRLNNILQIKDNKITTTQSTINTIQQKCQQLQHKIQSQTYQSIQQSRQLQQQLKLNYNQLKQSLKQQNQSIIDEINKNYLIKEELLVNEINQLKKFIVVKNQDRQKLITIHQQRIHFNKQQLKQYEEENTLIKHRLQQVQQQAMQQLQLLKVKMTTLHQTNITTLVKTYQQKIQSLINQLSTYQQTISRLNKNLYEQTNRRYQMRKKYSIEFSKLNEKVIKLRSGIVSIQNDFKQKLQNQKSVLLLTSRNLIKDITTKQTSNKTTLLQLHKIQLLYQENYKQLQTSNQIIDQKVKIAQQQLHRLTSHVMEQKKRHIQTENNYKLIVKSKNQQIEKLQQELNNIAHPQFDNSKQLQLIQQLKAQLHEKKLESAQLKDHCQLLEKKIAIMKAQLDQYHIESEITQQQAKQQYQKISQQNMDQFMKFYQNRIQVLQEQKNDLKQLISSKQQKITSLVQKYQQLQKTMKDTLGKIKKRTQLQTKVMNLGMDNNLVKNMAEIIKND